MEKLGTQLAGACVLSASRTCKRKKRQRVVIVSVMRTEWSSVMDLKRGNMSRQEIDRRMKDARAHFMFVCQVYRLQQCDGRYFVRGHQAEARPWAQPCIQTVLGKTDAQLLTFDQCMFGLGMRTHLESQWRHASGQRV